jgi:hypothetical protein
MINDLQFYVQIGFLHHSWSWLQRIQRDTDKKNLHALKRTSVLHVAENHLHPSEHNKCTASGCNHFSEIFFTQWQHERSYPTTNCHPTTNCRHVSLSKRTEEQTDKSTIISRLSTQPCNDTPSYLKKQSEENVWSYWRGFCGGAGDVVTDPNGASLLSDVDNLDSAAKASGKFGGVTGVFAGVHIGKWQLLPFLHVGLFGSWKNLLRAVSKCQFESVRSCLACSGWHPATYTNWLSITCCRIVSIFRVLINKSRLNVRNSDEHTLF